MSRTKVHTIYKNGDGKRLPSVTTILGELGWNKRSLMHWAWKMGCEGEDYRKVSAEAADIGTCAHDMIHCHLTGKEFDASVWPQDILDKAETAFLAYLDWEKSI